MDIYDYLKKDHQKVADLFKLFEKATDPSYKKEIVAMLTKELLLHATSEQQTFYKALEKFPESKSEAVHGEEEHTEIETKLRDIHKVKTANADWERKVLELKKIVDHHVNEEEGKMFQKAKEVLSKEDAWVIKEKMHDYKEKMLRTMKSI